MLRAARSLTEPPGLKPSSLANRRTPGRSIPAVSLRISSSGVLPIRSSTLSARWTGTFARSASAGDCRDDRDVVAILDLRVELLQKPDVFAVQVDVDEPAELALVIEQPLAHPRMALLEILDHGAHRYAAGRDLIDAGCEPAERSGHSNPDCHIVGLASLIDLKVYAENRMPAPAEFLTPRRPPRACRWGAARRAHRTPRAARRY